MSAQIEPKKFPMEVRNGANLGKFKLVSESLATTWGIENTAGKPFKISNADMIRMFEEILKNWDAWENDDLNNNKVNPDETLSHFVKKYSDSGAHKELAAVQRRGFLHLISAIVFTAKHNRPFDIDTADQTFHRDDYERALSILQEIESFSTKLVTEENAANGNSASQHSTRKTGGVNRIFYGAPGTGKSYEVNRLTEKAGHEVIRTVFHPDIQNNDFVGSLKPAMNDSEITYQFSPGAFAKALVAAVVNPEKHVSLIIEELNRAPAAAVFGELFLLLDRDTNGGGEYDSDFPSEEFMFWYQHQTGTSGSKMRLPSNLSIYATMNSADQGVYPLDTAFRRRWQQDYVKIDYENAPLGNILVYEKKGESTPVKWSTFIKVLNKHLSALPFIEEDRLIGPWFIKQAELKDDIHIPGKLLIYLWDDLLRHDGREAVFATERFSTYGSLSSASDEGSPILSESLLAEIELNSDDNNSNEQ